MKSGDYMPFVIFGAVGAGLYLYYKHLQQTCAVSDSSGACGLYNSVFSSASVQVPAGAINAGGTGGTPKAPVTVNPSVSPTGAPAKCMDKWKQNVLTAWGGDSIGASAAIQKLSLQQLQAIANACESGAVPDFIPFPPVKVIDPMPPVPILPGPIPIEPGLAPQSLADSLIQAGSATPSTLYNVWQWNAVLQQIQAGVANLETADNSQTMTAASYVAARKTAGLSGLGAPHRIPAYLINRRRIV